MKLPAIKKALFLDNEHWENNNILDDLIDDLKENNIECEIFDRAHLRLNEIGEKIAWCDSIFFFSTFLYPEQIEKFYKLLMAIPPKHIFGKASNGDLAYNLERVFSKEQLNDLSKHQVYDMNHLRIIGDHNWFTEIDMSIYGKEIKAEKEEDNAFRKGIRKTGRKIIIKKIQAGGGPWSILKEGSVVDELDPITCEQHYNGGRAYKRGVWVMAKDTPVKLINDNGYDEWEFENPGCKELTIEFFSRAGKLDQTELMATVQLWINNCTSPLILSGTDRWEWCDNLCNTLGLERRGNRTYFDEKLEAYGKKHYYFKELDINDLKPLYKSQFKF